MNYFITGGTGFIGRFLIEKLLDRGGCVYVLSREQSVHKVEQMAAGFGVSSKQLIPVIGDLLEENLGLSATDQKKLAGKIDHFFHLAAIYDIKAGAEAQIKANTQGTQHAIDLARTIKARCFHHVSSIAAAGLYNGTFTEDMFDEACNMDNPYFRTKHDSEGLVREVDDIPWRIYRPGIVVGHSQTGEIDKIDGPYYFFKAIKSISNSVPRWMHSLMVGGGKLNIVPVDYVVDALDYLAHDDDLDYRCFFLTQPEETSVGELFSQFLQAAHGPKLHVVGKSAGSRRWLEYSGKSLGWIRPVRKLTNNFLAEYDIPQQVLPLVTYPTHFDSTETAEILSRGGITCPDLAQYADVLWQYWIGHFDEPVNPSLMNAFTQALTSTASDISPKNLRNRVDGKVVVVTGATSGIGHEVAIKLAKAGAQVILVARTPEKLKETLEEIVAEGGSANSYACDLADLDSCEKLINDVLEDYGQVDILINNAGRSIRRSVSHSFDRFHDYQRTMQLNYFGSLKLIMGFLPSMIESRGGHVINISSIGVLASPPRFSAYVASKSALDAFSWCAAAEFAHRGIHFTTINMPLVATPMIAPTKLYKAFPTLTPDQAANLVCKAVAQRPKRVATGLGKGGAVAQALAPNISEFVLNQAFHLFPDSSASQGKDGEADDGPQSAFDAAGQVFAQLLRGIYW